MREQFCNYDISLKLKNLGFDESCLAWHNLNALSGFGYWKQEKNIWRNSELHTGYITAPLFQQATEWLREKHGIYIQILRNKPGYDEYCVELYKVNESSSYHHAFIMEGNVIKWFRLYKEARIQAILKAIEILEENE